MAEETQRKWVSVAPQDRKVMLWVYGLMAVALAFWVVQEIAHPSGATSTRQRCEQLWGENRATANQGLVPEGRYVANCMETQRQIEKGGFPIRPGQ